METKPGYLVEDALAKAAEIEAAKEIPAIRQGLEIIRQSIRNSFDHLTPPVVTVKGACAKCGTIPRKLHRHHIFPKWAGGIDEAANLIDLCPSCHKVQDLSFRRHFLKLAMGLSGTITMGFNEARNEMDGRED